MCYVVHGGIVHQIGGCTTCEAADEIERLRAERDRWRRLAHWQHHPDSSKCYDVRNCECVELDYEAMIDMEKKAVCGND
jgi:hypothetical protein